MLRRNSLQFAQAFFLLWSIVGVYWTEDGSWRQLHWPGALKANEEIAWSLSQGVLTISHKHQQTAEYDRYLLPSDVGTQGEVISGGQRPQDFVLRFPKKVQ